MDEVKEQELINNLTERECETALRNLGQDYIDTCNRIDTYTAIDSSLWQDELRELHERASNLEWLKDKLRLRDIGVRYPPLP